MALGLSADEIRAGFDSFPGLAHRMQIVARRGHVVFVNDSKATNADAAEKSLSSFESIHWIAGGLAEGRRDRGVAPALWRIEKAYLIGEAAPAFAATLGEAVPYEISGTLDAAVSHAARERSRVVRGGTGRPAGAGGGQFRPVPELRETW
jgi:UDP-N-acetylmuramoylalanine--D-glutamate ligase